MQDKNYFFEIVPEEYVEETVESSPSEIDSYCERAISEGFTQDVVERAKEQAKACKSYDEFTNTIESVLNSLDEEERKEAQRKMNIQRSIQRSVRELSSKDIMKLIDDKISEVYNTTAVTSLELVESCLHQFTQEMLQLYLNCAYAVYLCMKSKWVSDNMKLCLDRWESSMEVKNYVGTYLKSKGATEDNLNSNIRKLPTYLPDEYKNEKSPIMYQAYKTVTLMTHKSGTGYDGTVLSSPTYFKMLQKYYKKGVPLKAACTMATYAACKKLELKVSYGYTVMLPYTGYIMFDAAFNNALGNLKEEYEDSIKEEQVNDTEEKIEQSIKESEKVKIEKPKIDTTPVKVVVPPKPAPVRKQPPKKQSVNIAPYIPIWFCALFVHIIVCVIMLLFSKKMAAAGTICFIVATVGWFARENGNEVINGKNPLYFIAGGYAAFVACLILL